MIRIFQTVLLAIVSAIVGFMIISITFVEYWSHTEAGKVPPKTAVLLHAIHHNLVTPDMRPPKFLTQSNGHSRFKTELIQIPVSDGASIPARVYQPKASGPHPIILYYHGGAFLEGYGDINTHDNIVRALAVRTGSIVVAVGYRVAPGHPFPTAIEDSYDALDWISKNAELFNGDPANVAVVGDSAGGNIATVVSLMARDREGPEISAQVLLYPLTTFQDVAFPSRDHYDSGYYLLSRAVMVQAREKYTPQQESWLNPYTSPLNADLEGVPPAFVVTAEFDPLRDEGEMYAQSLADAGVPVQAIRYNGVMHGFVSFYEVMERGDDALHQASMFLKKSFYDDMDAKPYELVIDDVPSAQVAIKDRLEAYAIGGFLIGKQSLSLFSGW
ncbi:alpha/beta hydrolase [Halalkalibacterium halodurans]|jgi:acetyl esterase|uniref:Lipase (Esterase) n=2 Tax=Halalkalibacterium halodurans TaxID=86665 RepID=Q9KAN9_HALH5|nr:alpha/beta hydrolase fold domain-containing protein [Halalkalibacterium halodurans]MDY7222800.1 alpha/beta hydrolase [Halalkalibacterium halodurans]MDY7242021.1 alpha/beta hydrolase [Halalkalibacterium halodurans]MED3645720.1 alpha/beta hydrolase [Halalkalibacterium halodurans]MED4080968.1 alpha/beta hydrolase [Halalkalibacterium halodurans]MED4085151.1 alpha/beta hydrolase [Halalkalibacterium halodurans]